MSLLDEFSSFSIVAKVTPFFCLQAIGEEYIVSRTLFCPLKFLKYKLENEASCYGQCILEDSYAVDDFIYYEEGTVEFHMCKNVCFCASRIVNGKFYRKVRFEMDILSFSFIMFEMRRSKLFRTTMLFKVYAQYVSRRSNMPLDRNFFCPLCNKYSWTMHVIVFLNEPKKNILDYKWNKRIQVLVNQRCELENAMAWLSTLGGAFSALGDDYLNCAEKAGAISMQQLSIALRLGDPLTICRCKIYLAMSLLQRGYYRKTKRMIKELYKFSTEGEGSKDFRLKNMCIAVWNKLKYVLSQKAIKYNCK